MPKIVINEYDLTKAGTGEYRNFSVVVPGFLSEDKYVLVGDEGNRKYELGPEAKAVFDENGIYECSSTIDFEQNIGKRAATVTSCFAAMNAKAPKPSMMLCYDPNLAVADGFLFEEGAGNTPTKITYQSYDAYTIAFNQALEGFVPASAEEVFDAKTEGKTANDKIGVYYATAREDGAEHVGRLLAENVKYNAVVKGEYGPVNMPDVAEAHATEELILEATEVPSYDTYYIIDEDNLGTNGDYVEDRISHYGNQMAYELIGMGYTVLFKAMTEYSADEITKIVATRDEETGEIVNGEDGKPVVDLNTVGTDVLVANGTSVFEDIDGAVVLNSDYSAINQLGSAEFWECLKDKSTYDFRYIVTGLLTHNDAANTCILEVADHSEEILLDDASIHDGRGDCIALIDLDCAAYVGKTQSAAIPELAKEAAKWSSAYAAVFAPYVTYLMADDKDYNNNKTFPASFHYLACAANSANNNFSEWYANAGYTRGVSKYTIESTGCKFGEIAIQSLEPRFLLKVGKELNEDKTAWVDINTSVAVNLIVKIKSSYYLWGNRTGKKLGTRGASDGDLVAQHFLNIRQLCSTIKKQVYTTCRRLTFDPNSNVLWINFRDLLTPMLEQMKADQGIKDYKIIKNATDRKALLSAKIRIVPIEAVEDFEIGLYLEDSLDEVALTEA
jgi:hypothetical protein